MPPQASEATSAVADFDGNPAGSSLPEVQPEPIAPASEPQPVERAPQEIATAPATFEPAGSEHDKPAPRRSTVREKVSFVGSGAATESAAPVVHTTSPPEAPAPAESTSEATSETQPRRAGWWSRRFGGGE